MGQTTITGRHERPGIILTGGGQLAADLWAELVRIGSPVADLPHIGMHLPHVPESWGRDRRADFTRAVSSPDEVPAFARLLDAWFRGREGEGAGCTCSDFHVYEDRDARTMTVRWAYWLAPSWPPA